MKHFYVVTTEKIKTLLEHPSENIDNPEDPLYCWSLDDFNNLDEALGFKAQHPEKDHLKLLALEKF